MRDEMARAGERTTRAHTRLLIAAMAAALLAIALIPRAAQADESYAPTAQAAAYNAAWVPYLDPPQKLAAVCLVDSGVDVTPDTPADSPDGPIIERTALDGGPGTGVDSDHGTYMAMEAGAPVNGWGTIGFWPGLRIYSIRALPQGQTTFPFASYTTAVNKCAKESTAVNIVAVNLSLACNCSYDSADLAALENMVATAHSRYDVSVVASAGNNASTVGMPAAASGVFGVGAGNLDGALCAFSNSGPELDLIAPGCQLDGAWPSTGEPFVNWIGGTSPAAAIASATIALVRSYRPDLDWQAAEQLLRSSAHASTAGEDALDVEAAFRAAGLGDLVDAAKQRMPPLPPPTSTNPGSSTQAGGQDTPSAPLSHAPSSIWADAGSSYASDALPVPRVDSVRRLGRKLIVSVGNRPRFVRLIVLLQVRLGEFGYATAQRSVHAKDTLIVRIPRRWDGGRLVLRYELSKRPNRASADVYRAVRP
jgi:hypothetical protein